MRESIEEVYAQFLDHVTKTKYFPPPTLVSGVPERSYDDLKISDVDCIIWGNPKLAGYPEWITKHATYKENYSNFNLNGFARQVNIRVTNDPVMYIGALNIRMNELAIANEIPELIPEVQQLKKNGMDTAGAWAKILGLTGDIYEEMKRPANELIEIAKSVHRMTSSK